MNGVGTTILYTFAVYMAVVLLISFVAWARNRSLKDYILAGRGLGNFTTALSAEASDMSGWLLLALPGAAYAFGLGEMWMVIGLIVGTYINWLVVARKLREETQHYGDALTLPDYFAGRFGDRTHLLRGISALFILVFFVFYTSSGFVAGADLFQRLFGVPYFWALVYGTLIVVSYTFIGGFLAVAWNDVLQGSIMFFALVVVGLLGLAYVGWFHGLGSTLNAVNAGLLHPFYDVQHGRAFGWIAIVSLLAWGLGYFGQPHILARFMAIKDSSGIPTARRIAMFWVIIALVAAMIVGMTGLGVVNHPLAGDDRERVFIFMSLQLLPAVLAGIALAGILAAIMSTASAQLLVAASAFAEDLYHAFFRRRAGR
ncbi:MAG TPA: sodium/proline symporter, partial [Gammaproteobacteria bacterium]|nr:sodium/proline symporter [Gammaproteobacteria bacterium]